MQAISAYSTARGYIQGTTMIWLSPLRVGPNIEATFLSIHMLLGFAVELYLKAWLLQRGLTAAQVKERGHDLARLHAECMANELPSIAQLDELVDHLHGPHSRLEYRYITGDISYGNTELPLAFKILGELDTAVDTFVAASQSYGLRPGH